MTKSAPSRRAILRTSASFVASAAGARAAGVCRTPSADMHLLQSVMQSGRFIAYQPSAQSVIDGKLAEASEDSIKADLVVLRPYFDGLITYGCQAGAERVPDVAASLGFRAVILGVWDFYNTTERANAIAAWRRNPSVVAGLSLGNEIVLGGRGTWGDIAHALGTVRNDAPGLPLSASEAFAQFLDDPESRSALRLMDFLLVNVHPIYETWFWQGTAVNWADFVAKVADRLAAAFCGPVIVKETGVPSGPAAARFSEDMQHDFWRALEARMPPDASRAFAYFSAFDAPWRVADFNPAGGNHPEEAHWGFFTADRSPKKVVADLTKLVPAH